MRALGFRRTAVATISAVMFVTGAARTQPRAEPAADEVAIARAGNEFALSLYQRLAAEREGNLFFSPFSANGVGPRLVVEGK